MLGNYQPPSYLCSRIGVWRSWLAHLVWDQRVESSSLFTPTKKNAGRRPCVLIHRGAFPSSSPRRCAPNPCLEPDRMDCPREQLVPGQIPEITSFNSTRWTWSTFRVRTRSIDPASETALARSWCTRYTPSKWTWSTSRRDCSAFGMPGCPRRGCRFAGMPGSSAVGPMGCLASGAGAFLRRRFHLVAE